MKKIILSICLITFLVSGCTSNKMPGTPAQEITSVPTFPQATITPLLPSPAISATSAAPAPVTDTPLPVSQLKSQCLDVKPGLAGNVITKGIVILNGWSDADYSSTYTLDMSTNKLSQRTRGLEYYVDRVVSPDKTMLAYRKILLNTGNKIIQNDLVIANANGQILKTILVEKEWSKILGWADNQHLFIQLAASNRAEDSGKKPLSTLILNPFNNETKILRPDFPSFLDAPSTILPYWNGWSGVIYDPTLTRAIYPSFFAGDNEMFTYVLWDMSSRKVVVSLENIFTAYILQNNQFPMPVWSPDNSQFVFRGLVPQLDRVVMELYSVSRDGVIKQLTHLDTTAYIFRSNLSWSPDGRYIVMFLGPVHGAYNQKAHVAVLDMKTLDVTDYCFPVGDGGTKYSEEAPAAIWSPNSEQFLVQDWYEKNHRRVILVDISRNVAAQVAEDMEAVGWMLDK